MESNFGESGRVAMCRVNCDAYPDIAKRFLITKYPTLKISLNGDVMKREYRGQRSAEALSQFVTEQLQDPIKTINHVDDLKGLDAKRRIMIAYFPQYNSFDYDAFRRVAANLKDDCEFYAGFGSIIAQVHQGGKFKIVDFLIFFLVMFLHSKMILHRSTNDYIPT